MSETEINSNVIAEEYKIWRKNVPYLYDLMFCHALRWPTLSVQWFPETKRDEVNGKTTQRLLFGTHTSGLDQEYIHIAAVEFPDKYDEAMSEDCKGDMRFKIVQSIPVESEPNIIRYNYSACNILATRFDSPDIHIFDYTKHLAESLNPNPDMILKGHEKGGFGLSWSPLNFAELASGGEDGIICVYDINKEDKENHAKCKFSKHTNVVNDLSYSFYNEKMFVSVSDDKSIIVWDTRMDDSSMAINNAHKSDILSVHCSPLNSNLIATGSSDNTVKIWDTRSTEKPSYTLLGHSNYVGKVQWSPHLESVLASSSKDRRVCIWDLSVAGSLLPEGSFQDGPPELMFLHGGHTDNVFDIAWNPSEPLEITSVSENNILQIWQIPENI